MSHLVTIDSKIYDRTAVAAACQRLGLAPPTHGTAELFSGQVTGLLVRLPEWQYPVVIDTTSGSMQFDNFGGTWGNQVHLDRFLQRYEVEVARLEGTKRGHRIVEEALQDGSIKVQVVEGA